MLFCDDMVDLERCGMQRDWQAAVYATPRRPIPDTSNRVGIHSALFFRSPQRPSGFGLHHCQEIADMNIAIEFSRFRGG